MIRNLRRKFILVSMSLVTLVLFIVFAILLWTNMQNQQQDTYNSLSRALNAKDNAPPKVEIGAMGQSPKGPPPMTHTAIFTVKTTPSGQILEIHDENVTVSQQTVQEAVQEAIVSPPRGVIKRLQLRYLVKRISNDNMIVLAFADLSTERAAFQQLFITSLLVGLGGFCAFLGISILLSKFALRPVEKAWQQQRQFVADASHELKTPLTVILANAGILLAHPQDSIAKQQKWVEHTRDEAQRMKQLVEEMLFLARSDAAPEQRSLLPFDISDAAWNCLLPFEPVAFEQGVTLDSDILPNLFLLGVAGQIRQLIIILLDNACKYAGEHGQVHFTLDLVQDKIRIQVRNTGSPIPQDALPHLFERFYRVDKARAEGGYGLGLAIAQRIVQSHHGRISVESNAQTIFTVLLPNYKK